jgi:2-polyprenyl-3-methyl-5-hydroxy-6-metoxy-1,4-benzoquinol methylase
MKNFTDNRSIELALDIWNQRIADAKTVWEKFSNTFNKRNCPVCNADDAIELEKFVDLYPISKCSVCQTEYSNPCPSIEAITYYYNECKCNVMLHNLFKERSKKEDDFVNDYRLIKILELIKEYSSEGGPLNILEIGCGTGAFLKKLQSALIDDKDLDESSIILNGIDLDKNAISLCNDEKLKLRCENADEFDHGIEYDFILNFELIEHLIDPQKFITNIRKNLKKNGFLIMTTPNSLGLETRAIHYNKTRLLAHSIFPPMHLNAYNPRNMNYFLISNGFKAYSITTPGHLDISILLHTLDDVDDEIKDILNIDNSGHKALQKLTTYLDGSSHMFCVGKKI